MQKNLKLHEEILLLSLRDKKGTFASTERLGFALGGAILAELLLLKKVEIDEVKKNKKLLNLVNSTPTGDPVLDECIEKVKKAKRRAQIRQWVIRFAQVKKLKHKIAEQLCRKSILRADEDKILLIFTRKIYPEINPIPERQLIDRIKRVILSDAPEIDPRTAIITALAFRTNLLKLVIDKQILKDRKKRLKQIAEGQVAAKATLEAIQAVQAAVLVTVIFPAAAAGAGH